MVCIVNCAFVELSWHKKKIEQITNCWQRWNCVFIRSARVSVQIIYFITPSIKCLYIKQHFLLASYELLDDKCHEMENVSGWRSSFCNAYSSMTAKYVWILDIYIYCLVTTVQVIHTFVGLCVIHMVCIYMLSDSVSFEVTSKFKWC